MKTMQVLSSVLLLGLIMAPSTIDQVQEKPVLKWHTMKEAQKLAKENGKKIFIFGQADWCHYCKKMEKEVFTQKETIELMNKYFYNVELTVDSDEEITFNGETYTMSHMSGMLGIDATPTLFFVDEKGEFIARQPGFMPSDVFNDILTFVGTDSYKEMSFPEFHEKMQ